MSIGKRIKSARIAAGLTQKELGNRCNMPDSQIRQYESGKVTPKLEQIKRLAIGLSVKPSDLLGYQLDMIKPQNSLKDMYSANWQSIETNDKNFLKIADLYYLLNRIGRQKVLDYTKDLTKIQEYRQEPSPGPGHDPAADPDHQDHNKE